MPAVGPSFDDHPLARAVFASLYVSRTQRALRLASALILLAKHGLRGLAFSWPVYLLALGGFYASSGLRVLLWSLALPGIGLSLYILLCGVREEYASRVIGWLLKRADLLRLLKTT